MYYKKCNQKQIMQSKKNNFRIYEEEKFSLMGGYEYSYILTDYEKNFIKTFCNYQLLVDYLKKEKGVGL